MGCVKGHANCPGPDGHSGEVWICRDCWKKWRSNPDRFPVTPYKKSPERLVREIFYEMPPTDGPATMDNDARVRPLSFAEAVDMYEEMTDPFQREEDFRRMVDFSAERMEISDAQTEAGKAFCRRYSRQASTLPRDDPKAAGG